MPNKLNSSQQQMYQFFKDRFLGYLSRDLVDFFSPEDLDNFLLERFSFIQQKEKKDKKIEVFRHDKIDWQANKTSLEILCDDMDFLVDSIREYFTRKNLDISMVAHPTLAVIRDEETGQLKAIEHGEHIELYIYIELEYLNDEQIAVLKSELVELCVEIQYAVDDWRNMIKHFVHDGDITFPASQKIKDMLNWIFDQNMIILGLMLVNHESFMHKQKGKNIKAKRIYGLFKDRDYSARFNEAIDKVAEVCMKKKPFLKEGFFIYHSKIRTRVERNAEINFIFLQGAKDWLIILGDFTTRAQVAKVEDLPMVRDFYFEFIQKMGSRMGAHSSRMARTIFNYLPVELKFSLPVRGYEEVFRFLSQVYFQPSATLNISWFGDHRALVIVTIPDEQFKSEQVEILQNVLQKEFGGHQINSYIQFEKEIVKIYYLIHVFEKNISFYKNKNDDILIQAKKAIRTWEEDLKDIVVQRYSGDTLDLVLNKYLGGAFEQNYQNNNTIEEAIGDINYLLRLKGHRVLVRIAQHDDKATLRIYSENPMILSEILPVLTSFGLKVIREIVSRVTFDDTYIYIFQFDESTMPPSKERFSQAVRANFMQNLLSDIVNSLLLTIDIDWMELSFLKSLRSYVMQTSNSWSKFTLNKTLIKYPLFCFNLLKYVEYTFVNPDKDKADLTVKNLESELETVATITEDSLLRQFMGIVVAIQRTNYKKMRDLWLDNGSFNQEDYYLSFKIKSSKVPVLPKPRPLFEIFVFSTFMRGIHLRGGKVARGGLRWSDRPDDFRTEVLGLMKTQMVKNAVIVPVGSKGGFVLDNPSPDRSIRAEQGKQAYRMLIAGLLDLTDNFSGKKEEPSDLIALDDFDPYLVVAADKGTANFSDIANSISRDYNFWLDDAFASGGSAGYNHKEYGITANGSWESIKRHFFEFEKNVYKDTFSVIAIGDLGGDVFGNGMIYTDKIRLVAAFNHLHIFIDPDPDPKTSFMERKRLFKSKRAGWDQYNQKLISKGGGVFSRDEKKISLSPQMQELLQTEVKELSGIDLIQLILKADADLFFNGGIGTYVKGSQESHADIGDKANDAVRVDAVDLKAKIVGEGGNLGFSQRGRIEFSRNGGLIFTDALDNSGGVDMSDHEVNLKILFSDLLRQKKIKTFEDRNKILNDIGIDVTRHVLLNNYLQALSVSLDYKRSLGQIYNYIAVMDFLEENHLLDRATEFIPKDEELLEFSKNGIPRPILAVLLGYVKIYLYNNLLLDEHFNENLFTDIFLSYFPPFVVDNFNKALMEHKLRRQITATIMTNNFVNILGSAALYEITRDEERYTKVVQNYYLLNLAANGIAFRKEIYKNQQSLGVEKFDFLLMQNSENFKDTLKYIETMAIDFDESLYKHLLNFFQDWDRSYHSEAMDPRVQSVFAEKLLNPEFEILYCQTMLLKPILQTMLVITAGKNIAKNGQRIKVELKKGDLIKVKKILLAVLRLNRELKVNLIQKTVENFFVDNRWENEFQERLQKRIEFYNISILDFILEDMNYDPTLIDEKIEEILNELPIFVNLDEELKKRKNDFLFVEYIIENSLGKICKLYKRADKE